MAAPQISEETKVTLDLKTIGMIVGFTITIASMYFVMQADIAEAKELPKEVLSYLLRSYGNKINDDYSYISFRLIKDTNFLFSEPLAMLNTMYEKGNIDSNTGIALRDINKDDELFGNYGDSSQIKLI